MGGYTSVAWSCKFGYCADGTAFLFELQGSGIIIPFRMRLRGHYHDSGYSDHAIRNCASFGPTFGAAKFGGGGDMVVNEQQVTLNLGEYI